MAAMAPPPLYIVLNSNCDSGHMTRWTMLNTERMYTYVTLLQLHVYFAGFIQTVLPHSIVLYATLGEHTSPPVRRKGKRPSGKKLPPLTNTTGKNSQKHGPGRAPFRSVFPPLAHRASPFETTSTTYYDTNSRTVKVYSVLSCPMHR